MSEIISVLFDVRTDSDYDDFFVISKADTAVQIENAAYFVDRIELYLNTREKPTLPAKLAVWVYVCKQEKNCSRAALR